MKQAARIIWPMALSLQPPQIIGNSGPDRRQASNERERHPNCGDEPDVLKNNVRRTEAEPNVIKHNKTPACALLREQESLALKPVSAVFPAVAGEGKLHCLKRT